MSDIRENSTRVEFKEKDNTKNDNDLNPIEYIEKYYPETSDEFLRLQNLLH